jgi:hypothetical protein
MQTLLIIIIMDTIIWRAFKLGQTYLLFQHYFTTYYSNYANNTIQWQPLYSLNSAYNIQPNNYLNFFTLFPKNQNSPFAMNYINFYNGLNTNPALQQPITEPGKWPYYYCGINNMTVLAYQSCLANF